LADVVGECNNVLKGYDSNINALKVFFSDKHKMLSKFMTIFHGVISTKNINFGMFHFFGEMNYVYFLSSFLQYIFSLAPILHIYPDQEEIIFQTCCLLTETNLEIIVTYFEPESLCQLINLFAAKFHRITESTQNEG
jgi:hypothetical protein